MQSATRSLHRSHLAGWWLALLALCALNLQALQHYAPRMLLGSGICSTSDDDSGDKQRKGGGARNLACGICCAASGAVPVPPALQGLVAVRVDVQAAVSMLATEPELFREWSPSRPRGPPVGLT